jgi:hypothetical protein
MSKADTPWEPVETFYVAHPCFQLEDELFFEGERDQFIVARGEPPHVVDGCVHCNARVFVPASSAALATLLQLAHVTGHDGPQ